MALTPKKCLELLACIFSLVLLAFSIENSIKKIVHMENLAVSASDPQSWLVGTDMRLYLQTGYNYQKTGQLYKRSDYYGPLAPLYKFPPAFQLQLLPFTTSQNPEHFIKPIRFFMIFCYFSSCLAWMIYIGKTIRKDNQPNSRILLFFTLASLTALSSIGFEDCIFITNYEIPIFALLTAGFFLFKRHPSLTGIVIGYLACAKLYPAFMASFLLTRWNSKAIVSTLISGLIFTALGFIAFGMTENLFFFGHILPELLSEKVATTQQNMGFGGTIFNISQDIELTRSAFQLYRLAFLCLTIYFLIKNYAKLERCSIEVFALLMTLMLICMPNYWASYLIMLFPSLCIMIRRIVVQPYRAVNLIGLACLACMITYMQEWLSLGYPQWLHNEQLLDKTSRAILDYGEKGNMTMVWLMFALHYPWYTAIHFLEYVIFFAPAILWFYTASEIASPVLLYDSLS